MSVLSQAAIPLCAAACRVAVRSAVFGPAAGGGSALALSPDNQQLNASSRLLLSPGKQGNSEQN